jgi:hypothetical protein
MNGGTLAGYIHELTNSALVLFFVVVVLVGLLLIDAVFVAYSFSNQKFIVIWPLRVLRSVTSAMITIFFIPVFALFILVAVKSDWTSSLGAFAGALSLIIAVLYLTLSFVFTATFYARNPCIPDSMFVAKPHALFDLYYLGVKTLLTGLFIIVHHESYKWLLVLATLFCSVSCAYVDR